MAFDLIIGLAQQPEAMTGADVGELVPDRATELSAERASQASGMPADSRGRDGSDHVAYDPAYSRMATIVDGTGTTTYTYHQPGVLGAGQVAGVDGPLPDDTTAYVYDELGRVVTRVWYAHPDHAAIRC